MTAPALTNYANGVGQVSGDQFNTFAQTCDNFAQLRSFAGASGIEVIARGRTTPNDGLGGFFWWNPLNTAPDDNSTVIVPNGVTLGGWNLLEWRSPLYLPLSGGTMTGPLTAAATGVFTNTQMNTEYSFILNGLSPLTEWQAEQTSSNYATSALVAGNAVPSTSTVYGANGIASFVNSASSATNTVAGYFSARSLTAGARVWGLNPIVDDGGFATTAQGIEVDINSSNANSVISGVDIVGAFSSAPLNAAGVAVQATNKPFTAAFESLTGGAKIGLSLGPVASGNSQNSQPINLVTTNSGGTICVLGMLASTVGSATNLDIIGGGLSVQGLEVVTGVASLAGAMTVTASGSNLAGFYSGSSSVGSITTNGSTTAYNTTSDYRLKDISGKSDGSLIDKLSVHVGSFKADATHTVRSLLIAHEVQEVAPWMVTGSKDQIYEADELGLHGEIIHKKGDINPQMVDHSALIPDLIAKCQTLTARIAALEANQAKP